ncbi:MAG: ACP S-malonyltransferase [Desulfomonilaceae bacterium]
MSGPSDFLGKSFAVIFPGQGSQFPGMAGDLLENSELARQMMHEADSILGYKLSDIMAGAAGEQLNRTVYTQPAIFVHSMMLWRLFHTMTGCTPLVGAGHSLGEYSALCASGIISFEDALRCINVRSVEMERAQPAGSCGMVAVIGLNEERVAEIIDSLRDSTIVRIANFNSPDQTVISGNVQDLKEAIELLSREKRCRCVILPVSSAFHTDLMASARDGLFRHLASVEIKQAKFPIIANISAKRFPADASEIREHLANQIVQPVLWHQSVLTMLAEKPHSFVEIGPGKVLSGLMRRIDRTVNCANISSWSEIIALQDMN